MLHRLLSGVAAVLCAACLLASPASAGGRERLGFGMLFTNDAFGDGDDRWRTASIASSYAWGPKWQGRLPRDFGDLIELRVNGEVIAPADLGTLVPNSRRYAQALSLEVFSHFAPGAVEFSLGGGLVLTGPMLGLDDLQNWLHGVLGANKISSAIKRTQIDNHATPELALEMGRNFELGGTTRIRPFFEARAGVETYLRLGADLTFGLAGDGGFDVRAPVTGFRYSIVPGIGQRGFSFVAGGDVTQIFDSRFLSDNGPTRFNRTRTRLRAGLRWNNRRGSSIFYGVTWLDKEFASQPDSQLTGAVQVRIVF